MLQHPSLLSVDKGKVWGGGVVGETSTQGEI